MPHKEKSEKGIDNPIAEMKCNEHAIAKDMGSHPRTIIGQAAMSTDDEQQLSELIIQSLVELVRDDENGKEKP